MGSVKITFLAQIRSVTKNRDTEFPIDEKETIRGLLSKLTEKFGEEFRDMLFDAKGARKAFETEVHNGDTILIVPAIAGG